MELKDLVGERQLSGVEITSQEIEVYGCKENIEVILFVLDGVTYKAQENPDDGYRSYLNEIEVTDLKCKNVFPQQTVEATMKPDGEWSSSDVLQLTDMVTGKPVLELGTDNYDDYYPWCVISWQPENLAINIGR